jgi:tyrosine decarboxylase/aspartate 1-decarboxylase
LGLAGTAPSRVSLDAFAAFSQRNPNNIGWHAPGEPAGPFAVTQKLELEVVEMLASLLGGALPEVGGVVTAGGTESNTNALWLGRNVLREAGAGSIAVLVGRSAHHSVPTGCDVTGLGVGDWQECSRRSCTVAGTLRDEGSSDGRVAHRYRPRPDGTGLVLVDLDSRWRMDLEDLQRRIRSTVRQGVTGLLVIATVGSPSIGAADDVAAMGRLLAATRVRKPGVQTFLHVDAAMAGMILPFLDPPRPPIGFELRDASGSPVVDSLTVDLHKAGLAPYPAGVFLCRMALRGAIEVPRPFDPGRFDATVAGSRPGAAAAAAWAVLQERGRTGGAGARGFSQEAVRALRLAAFAARQFRAIGAMVIADPETNIIAVSFPADRFDPAAVRAAAISHVLTPVFVSRSDADCPTRAYRMVFLPHVRRREIAAAASAFARIRRETAPPA